MSRSAYEITRLAFADVVAFRRILDDLREERQFRRMSYVFARGKIQEFHDSDNDTSVLTGGIADLEHLEAQSEGSREEVEPRNNREVLESYLEHFASPFRCSAGSLPGEFDSFSMEIGGLRITGKPHLKVLNSRRNTKYLYLLTSREWSDQQKSLFISILSEIVSQNVDDASPRDVEGLDCRTGRRVIKGGLGPQFRSRLTYLVENLRQTGLD